MLVRALNSSSIAAVEVGGPLLFERPGSSADWSPDGKQVAFCGDGGLWVMRRDGTGAARVVDGVRCNWADAVAWSAPTPG